MLPIFIFLSIQWIDDFGWYKTTENEKEALFYFFKEVGKRFKISAVPSSLEELKIFVEGYEQCNFHYEKSNNALASATNNIIKGWMPFFAKHIVLLVIRCLLDQKMLKVLGYKLPPLLLKNTVVMAMKARAYCRRAITFIKYPSFVSTERNRTYPKGYQIVELGPHALIHKI